MAVLGCSRPNLTAKFDVFLVLIIQKDYVVHGLRVLAFPNAG